MVLSHSDFLTDSLSTCTGIKIIWMFPDQFLWPLPEILTQWVCGARNMRPGASRDFNARAYHHLPGYWVALALHGANSEGIVLLFSAFFFLLKHSIGHVLIAWVGVQPHRHNCHFYGLQAPQLSTPWTRKGNLLAWTIWNCQYSTLSDLREQWVHMVKPATDTDGAELASALSSSRLNRHSPVISRGLLTSWHWLVFSIILQGTFPEKKTKAQKNEHSQDDKAIQKPCCKIRNTWSTRRPLPFFPNPREARVDVRTLTSSSCPSPSVTGQTPQTFQGSATQDSQEACTVAPGPHPGALGKKGGAPKRATQMGWTS